MTTPAFLSRLLRPFTTSAQMSVVPSTTATTTQSANTPPSTREHATFAGGCFWGVEHAFQKRFPQLQTRVGYTSSSSQNPDTPSNRAAPTYQQVCAARTPHTEAVQIAFDPAATSYRELVEFFFRMHDPTTRNRQGADSGAQYRSAVFWHGDAQEAVVRDVVERAGKEWWTGGKIVTELAPAGKWWDAEEYHQQYLDKNPGGYECPSHYIRSFPALSKPESDDDAAPPSNKI
ncbi:MAG: Peptide-methionine (S)-S-oxide reductase [Geoglossum umbratile]|nr:MAG: Peptide-methionine (S)-S-oxide reductase [Geoglossum umbratile]